MSTTRKSIRAVRPLATLLTVGMLATSLAACSPADDTDSGSGGDAAASDSPEGIDDGTELTLWTRAPMEKQATLLVDAYNASHKNQVSLTITPNDDYVAKVGAAAGSSSLPDLFAADIVYVPNWTSQGLFTDITDRIDGLPYADELAQGHVDAGTYEDQEHVLPFVLDLSVMFYNKDLYREAGLDPEKPPTTLKEYGEHAKAISGLGKDGVSGTYFGGNCGGCTLFTWFPSVWAGGDQVLSADGTESLLASDTAKDVYAVYKDMVDSGAIGTGTKDETGATWTGPFQEGKVGVMPYPATLLSTAAETVDVGVAPIPGPDGGESTFVGGDGIGISKDSKNEAAAWNFLSWLTSEDAQVEVLAKNNDVVSRADLADNKYAAVDPRLVTINEVAAKGSTPVAINFQQAFNAPDSPWLTLVRGAVFGDAKNIDADNDEITAVLDQ
ncbi:sugar ABC transporter substrate-binding protein [Oerskovia turbata]|uniref:Sugar ABC transporter substrate-binding protein n=1 Tax=Oerskovia turbata TaxID=1713 RepID=A0A4Q1L2K1_9CELL|nr:sugar ABC transporter substrate-binding protein [Oerskovia turbata]RXR26970.1 sugar ABC transporter substrate-binding protein [Oerskovia turbata]RXR36187.1 sugar ABC transporter substrate-binding protein [Oerskovia turbata]TGJ95380.1 sugar ABC transporter substrate-binding protein [Actinotalea fermentans ATCC 43279 = JCM 9966 = DSM 3133]